MNTRFALLAALALVLVAGAAAQTVTVAQSGTPTYGTVQAAIDHFDPDPDGGTPNVIQITDAGVYDEIITVDVPVTIEGTGPSRPVIAIRENAAVTGDTGGNDGLVINIPAGTLNDVTLRNLIFLPSTALPPPDDGIRSYGQNINLLMENCLVCPNNGSNAPVSTDGLTEVSLTGTTPFGDDGMFLGGNATPAGSGMVVTLRNVVVTHNQSASAGDDGLVCSISSTGGYVIEDGCVFSYNGRLGIQGNGSFQINAPTTRVMVIGNQGFAGIWFSGVGAGTSPVRTLNGVNVLNNTQWGLEHQNGGGVPFSLSNAIIAGNGSRGVLIGEVGTSGAVTISDVTIARNATAPIETNAAFTGAVTITDSIIAGDGSGTLTLLHNGTTAMDISFSALVTAGGSRLATPPTSGTGTVTQASVINDDPRFQDTTDPTSANFYDVLVYTGDSSPYRTAGTGGTPLTGGAGLLQITQTSVGGWSLYR